MEFAQVLADQDGNFAPDLGLALRRVLAPESEGGLAFVGVLEHYQQTICTLHALERGELLPFCDCTDKSQWSRFEGNYTIKLHRPTRQSDNRSDDGHDALIDELTRLDRKVYAAAVHRLRRDASRVERVHGVRLWCDD